MTDSAFHEPDGWSEALEACPMRVELSGDRAEQGVCVSFTDHQRHVAHLLRRDDAWMLAHKLLTALAGLGDRGARFALDALEDPRMARRILGRAHP